MNYIIGFIIVILVFISYAYYVCLCHPDFKNIDMNNINFKTGDMILFHAFDNINPIVIGSYYGHVALVYVDPDDPTKTPYTFEAAAVRNMHLNNTQNKKGIFFEKLHSRIEKYKGFAFYKELEHMSH